MRTPTWRVAALLFASGFCALVYQIGWLRELRLVFGVSTAASAAVLAIFIGGLGLGGLAIGSRADRHPRPILFYSYLETIVAVSAALSPFLLLVVRQGYVAAGGTERLGPFAGTLTRLVLAALVLAVPTIAMGGTLPAAARGVTGPADLRRRSVAVLYGLNTLGAVIGSLVATFWWLEAFGTRDTIWLAAALNLLVAVSARQVQRGLDSRADSHDPVPVSADMPAAPPGERRPGERGREAPVGFVLVASAVVGFAFFLMELVWYRMLGPLLGGSVFTFGLILAVALLGVGLGGLLYSFAGRERPATISGFAISCLVEAGAMAAGYALGDRLAILAFVLLPVGRIGFLPQVGSWAVVALVVILPSALAAGYQFPMLIALLGTGRDRVGRQIGVAYAANTLGAIAGSLAGGFGLLPWLTAPGAWRFAGFSLVALGIASVAVAAARGERRRLPAAAALVAVTAALFLTAGPTAVWRHSGIAAGRANLNLSSRNALIDWMRAERRIVTWEGEGVESSVALQATSDGYSFIVNGKSDGNARADAGTAVMHGLFGALVNPQARSALVVGLGTGSTAGWLAAVPAISRVDVVELEPLIVEVVARESRAVNHDALDNPKVHVTIADAREWLLTSRRQYDVIASEPSNPFRAGVASLFTRDYYRAGHARLSEHGVFVQWIQAYEVDAPTLQTVLATFAAVFAHVEVWQTLPGDLMLVGAKRAAAYAGADLAARIREEPFRTALASTWRAFDLEGVLAHFVADDRTVRMLASAPGIVVNTDDRNLVEFGFARSLGQDRILEADLRAFAASHGGQRPAIDGVPIDWDAVETERVAFHVAERPAVPVATAGPEDEQIRQAALVLYYRDRNPAAALAMWRRQSRPPEGPTELAMIADAGVEVGSNGAETDIEALRAYQPGEADTILAALRLREGRIDAAAAALERALRRFRTDPWALTSFKLRALGLAAEAAERHVDAAPLLFAALQEPLAVRAVDDARRLTAAYMTRVMDFPNVCRDAVGAMEPHVPWTAEFLTLRRDCYEATGDVRLAAAVADVSRFAAREPRPLTVRVR